MPYFIQMMSDIKSTVHAVKKKTDEQEIKDQKAKDDAIKNSVGIGMMGPGMGPGMGGGMMALSNSAFNQGNSGMGGMGGMNNGMGGMNNGMGGLGGMGGSMGNGFGSGGF